MKRILIFVLSILLILAACVPVSAHSGNTDSNGGHYASSTGQYHYHHGYPAHQHKNGECPYDFDDKTDHQSGLLSSGNSSSGGCSSSEGCGSSVSWIHILGFGVAFFIIALFIWSYSDSGSSYQANKPSSTSQSTTSASLQTTPKEDPEITKLKNEIQSLNRENKDLTAEVARLQISLSDVVNRHASENNAFEQQILKLESQNDELTRQLQLKQDSRSEAEKQELASLILFRDIFYPKMQELSKNYSTMFAGYPTLDAFYQQVSDKRFHRSLVEDISFGQKINFECQIVSKGKVYKTSLSSCTCPDFVSRKVPCKHMLFVAYNTGVILLNKERMERHLKIYLDEIREKDPDQKKSSSKNGKNSI